MATCSKAFVSPPRQNSKRFPSSLVSLTFFYILVSKTSRFSQLKTPPAAPFHRLRSRPATFKIWPSSLNKLVSRRRCYCVSPFVFGSRSRLRFCAFKRHPTIGANSVHRCCDPEAESCSIGLGRLSMHASPLLYLGMQHLSAANDRPWCWLAEITSAQTLSFAPH